MSTKSILLTLLLVLGLAFSGCTKDAGTDPTDPTENKDFVYGEKQTFEFRSAADIVSAMVQSSLYKSVNVSTADAQAEAQEIVTDISEELWKALEQQGQTAQGVHILSYPVKYKSQKPDGKEIWLSGRVLFHAGYPVFNPDGVLVVPHYTIGSNAECPSETRFPYELMFALENYIVFMPDYMGFGSTNGEAHPYLHYQWTAQAVYDMVKFGMKDMKVKSKNIYIAGYSQGGYSAYATLKFMEEKHAGEFNIKRAFVGAGPYDLNGTYNDAVGNKRMNMPCAIPMLVLGMAAGENAQWDMAYFFKKPMLDIYSDYILSKNYTVAEIDRKILDSGMKKLDDVLTPEALDKNQPKTKSFLSVLKKNSVYEWVPKTPVTFFHSSTDQVVPCLNTDNAYNYISNHTSDKSRFNLQKDDYGDHSSAGLKFYKYVFRQIWNWW